MKNEYSAELLPQCHPAVNVDGELHLDSQYSACVAGFFVPARQVHRDRPLVWVVTEYCGSEEEVLGSRTRSSDLMQCTGFGLKR